MGNTQYDAAEQWAIAAGRHPFIRPPYCTRDDHDTLDPFCGKCGEQLHEAGSCDTCRSGEHDGPSPYCPCCGVKLDAAEEEA